MNSKITQIDENQTSNQSLSLNKRIAFKMVPSTFEPPLETEDSTNYPGEKKLDEANIRKLSISRRIQNQREIKSSFEATANPNVQFVNSLTSDNEVESFDEGDCIPLNTDDRWIILSGMVKVNGANSCSFTKREGFIFFASPQTKKKVKQVLTLCPSTLYRVPHDIFKENIRNFLYVKNAQKVKFLKYCQFLVCSQSIFEDMAIAMDLISDIDKDTMIYRQGEEADHIYFVKEGIVLLERSGKVGNQIILDYEKNYESTYLSEEEGLLIVRKGMMFGADGILIKQVSTQIDLQDAINPQNSRITQTGQQYDQNLIPKLKSTRIYSAKSIGKCQLYKIDKNVVQTYLKSYYQQASTESEIKMSSKQLDRICLQYTNLLMGSNELSKEVRKKNIEFHIKKSKQEIEDMERKKKKVQSIKLQQKKSRKISLNVEHKKYQSTKQSIQQPAPLQKNKKMQLKLNRSKKNLSLPKLSRNYVQSLIMKKLQAKQNPQYMGYKRKIELEVYSRQHKMQGEKSYLQHQHLQIERNDRKKEMKKQMKKQIKDRKQDDREDLNLMNVKSYRSLLSPISAYAN